MAKKTARKSVGAMVVASLDKRIRVDEKLISRRQLFLNKVVELAMAGDLQAQKLLISVMEANLIPDPHKTIPRDPGVQEALERAARGEMPPSRGLRENDK
jgi:hypothetical protein